MEKFDDVDNDELLEVLSEHNGKEMVNKQNIGNVIDQIAHKELVHEPVFVRDSSWAPGLTSGWQVFVNVRCIACYIVGATGTVHQFFCIFTLQTNKKVFDVINCIW